VGDFVRKLIADGVATAAHDLSDGGLAVALAEMAMASGIGATIDEPASGSALATFFGEDQGRYLVTVAKGTGEKLAADGVSVQRIGTTGGSSLKLGNARAISVDELKAAHEGWFPKFMGN